MSWERINVTRRLHPSMRIDGSSRRFSFNIEAHKLIGNAEYVIAYLDEETRQVAISLLDKHEYGSAKLTRRRQLITFSNGPLIQRLAAMGVGSGAILEMKSKKGQELIFRF